jgi:putative transposase
MEVGKTRAGTRRSAFSHYLPRLRAEFYQADAVVFWTLTVERRATGWLNPVFHQVFRETALHAAAREGLICPAYCLMADHIHLVWMGVRMRCDQLDGMRFLRRHLSRALAPARFQHQAYDHVLSPQEREQRLFAVSCTDYVLLNPWRAGLVSAPADWPYLGAVIPGFPEVNPFEVGYWDWFWKRRSEALESGIQSRILPPREMA